MIEDKLNEYFLFLKCVFPLLKSDSSFLFHIQVEEEDSLVKKYEPMIKVSKESMIQTALLENTDSNIQVGELRLIKDIQLEKIFKN